MQHQSRFRISQRILALAFAALLILVLTACGGDTSSQQATPTTDVPNLTAPTQPPVTEQPTQAPPTAKPTTASALPSASELINLVQISPIDGKVTAATLTPDGQGKVGVGYDVTINNPTQTKIKHVAFEILLLVTQVSSVNGTNISFHAHGYTGLDDPIATDGEIAGVGNIAAMDENAAWTATSGVFDANLPA